MIGQAFSVEVCTSCPSVMSCFHVENFELCSYSRKFVDDARRGIAWGYDGVTLICKSQTIISITQAGAFLALSPATMPRAAVLPFCVRFV